MNTTMSGSAGGLTVFFIRFLIAKIKKQEQIGDLFYEAGHWLLLMVKIDDPLDAFSVHGMGGIAGLLLRPLLCIGGANGEMFGANVTGMFVIIAWSGGLSVLFFLPLKLAKVLSYGE